jgi:hypothetical protein
MFATPSAVRADHRQLVKIAVALLAGATEPLLAVQAV